MCSGASYIVISGSVSPSFRLLKNALEVLTWHLCSSDYLVLEIPASPPARKIERGGLYRGVQVPTCDP